MPELLLHLALSLCSGMRGLVFVNKVTDSTGFMYYTDVKTLYELLLAIHRLLRAVQLSSVHNTESFYLKV